MLGDFPWDFVFGNLWYWTIFGHNCCLSMCTQRHIFRFFLKIRTPKIHIFFYLDACGSVPNVRIYFLLSQRMFMIPIGTILRHAWFAHIGTSRIPLWFYVRKTLCSNFNIVCHMFEYHVRLLIVFFRSIFSILCNRKVCAHMWHILSGLTLFFSFFQFWQKTNLQKHPIFRKFFEVVGAFTFLSEKMDKTYFKQYLDSLGHEKHNFSRHNEIKVL